MLLALDILSSKARMQGQKSLLLDPISRRLLRLILESKHLPARSKDLRAAAYVSSRLTYGPTRVLSIHVTVTQVTIGITQNLEPHDFLCYRRRRIRCFEKQARTTSYRNLIELPKRREFSTFETYTFAKSLLLHGTFDFYRIAWFFALSLICS
jgi:hypothetical protein